MPSASRSSVAQFSVSASQLIKLISSVSSLVLKKRKVTAIVCVFHEKRRLKNEVPQCQTLNVSPFGIERIVWKHQKSNERSPMRRKHFSKVPHFQTKKQKVFFISLETKIEKSFINPGKNSGRGHIQTRKTIVLNNNFENTKFMFKKF